MELRGSEGEEGGSGLDGLRIKGQRDGVWSQANKGDEGSAQEIFGDGDGRVMRGQIGADLESNI